MGKHEINNDQATSVNVTEGNSQWIVQKGVLLSGEPALSNGGFANVALSVAGKILSLGAGIDSMGQGSKVTIAATGRLNAEDAGVKIVGDESRLVNDGRIRSETAQGVSINGDDAAIVNNGRILAASGNAIEFQDADGFSVRNFGTIASGNDQVTLYGEGVSNGYILNAKAGVFNGEIFFEDAVGAVEIVNKGKIAEGFGAGDPAIQFDSGDDRLVNRGLIGGDVSFGSGDDFGDFRRGDLGGAVVLGGTGDDVFMIDDASLKIFEFTSGGSDTIKTSVSYALGNAIFDHIERLTAIGKKDVDLTGNDQINSLTGNAGDNFLSGGKGDDILSGNGGNDTLDGGEGADDFYFFKNTGDDIVLGFDVDADVLHLVNVPGIGSMDDLEGHLTTAKDGDLVIDLGGQGSIRLDGIGQDKINEIEFDIFQS